MDEEIWEFIGKTDVGANNGKTEIRGSRMQKAQPIE